MKRLFSAAAFAAFFLFLQAWAGHAALDPDRQIQMTFLKERYIETLSLHARLSAAGKKPSAASDYTAALALIKMHYPESAKPLLERCIAENFHWKGWPSPQALLNRVDAWQKATPSRKPSLSLPGLEVFAEKKTPWTRPVLNALPEFLEAGRKTYGPDLPPLRFYLFSDRRTYKSFFKAAFNTPGLQDGTGNTYISVFCESAGRPAGTKTTLANIPHEFGHAWTNTYIRMHHDKNFLNPSMRKPYLDEGLAEYVASLWDGTLMVKKRKWAVQEASKKGMQRPSLNDLRTFAGFYKPEKAHLNYSVSALLAQRMLGPGEKGAKKIPRLLNALAKTDGDDRAAWRAATGKDIVIEFRALIRQLWRESKSSIVNLSVRTVKRIR